MVEGYRVAPSGHVADEIWKEYIQDPRLERAAIL